MTELKIGDHVLVVGGFGKKASDSWRELPWPFPNKTIFVITAIDSSVKNRDNCFLIKPVSDRAKILEVIWTLDKDNRKIYDGPWHESYLVKEKNSE